MMMHLLRRLPPLPPLEGKTLLLEDTTLLPEDKTLLLGDKTLLWRTRRCCWEIRRCRCSRAWSVGRYEECDTWSEEENAGGACLRAVGTQRTAE